MLQNLGAGSVLVALTVLIHTGGLILVAAATPYLARHLGLHRHDIGRTVVMAIMVLGIMAILTVEVWSWALAYTALSVTTSFPDGLYLSTVLFSTIGYGGVAFEGRWRLMTALEGIDGFLLIGWSTAFLVRASTRHGPFRREEHF